MTSGEHIRRGLISYNGSIVAVFGVSNIRKEVLAYSYNRKQFTIMTRKQRFVLHVKEDFSDAGVRVVVVLYSLASFEAPFSDRVILRCSNIKIFS